MKIILGLGLFVLVSIIVWWFMVKAYPKGVDLSWFKGNISHRGLYSKDQSIPENSKAAFIASIKEGYGIELDVQLTIDNQLVVFHDTTLKRMCGVDLKLTDCTYEVLSKYPLGNSMQTIPLFQEVLELVAGKVPLLIEIKTSEAKCKRLCAKTIELLKGYTGIYAMCSFNPLALIYFRKNAPEIIRGQLSKNYKHGNTPPFYQKIILQKMLINFITKPHYISYEYNQINLALRANKMYTVKCSGWAIDNKEDCEQYRAFYDVIIFEHFNPKAGS